ncbi:hypothetical protein MHBO_002794 [Bonamia ostreae]|uniref:Amine oxidase domain-containing protein n=1 Tax=Bonamia ostreae TaxID=126728 RepID=A0ABV2AP64_9EUKA
MYSLEGGVSQISESILSRLSKKGVNFITSEKVDCLNLGKIGENFQIVTQNKKLRTFDVVVSAVASSDLAKILRNSKKNCKNLLQNLKKIETTPILTTNIVIKNKKKCRFLDSFGFLVPHNANKPLLGATFDSNAFPNFDESEEMRFTVMSGGFRHRNDDVVRKIAFSKSRKEKIWAEKVHNFRILLFIKQILRSEKDFENDLVLMKTRSFDFPQYNVGHEKTVKSIERNLEHFPSLFVSGWSYKGLSVNSCIKNSIKTSRQIVDSIKTF